MHPEILRIILNVIYSHLEPKELMFVDKNSVLLRPENAEDGRVVDIKIHVYYPEEDDDKKGGEHEPRPVSPSPPLLVSKEELPQNSDVIGETSEEMQEQLFKDATDTSNKSRQDSN